MILMGTIHFTITKDLRFFLLRRLHRDRITHQFNRRTSVKDMIESLGVPHCEINHLVANNQPVDFSYLVANADYIDAYGFQHKAPVTLSVHLRKPYAGRPRFILDAHLGRLSSYLRMLGFDTLYRNDYPDR